MYKVNNKDTRTTPIAIFHNFEHVNAGWELSESVGLLLRMLLFSKNVLKLFLWETFC